MLDNVVLGYCHRPEIPHLFLECILDIYRSEIINTVIHEQTFYIAKGRNRVVKQFLETGKEWLLFVDDDMIFDSKSIEKLYSVVDKEKAPIVGALYFARANIGPSAKIIPVWMNELEGEQYHSVERLNWLGLQQVDIVGTGFMMIHRDVFIKMAEKFKDDWAWFGHDERNGIRLGEDVTFCKRAKELGYPIYGYPELCIGHLKSTILDYKAYMNQ